MDLVYIWQDASGYFRSKVKRVEAPTTFHSTGTRHIHLPIWNYDGSSTGQATTENSEVLLEPRKYYRSEEEKRIYVLCSTYNKDHDPVEPNTWQLLKLFDNEISNSGLKLGFEQEFFINGIPFYGNPEQGPFYCAVGSPITVAHHYKKLDNMVREVYERACNLGVKCTGYNLEVAPRQAEIQVCDYAINACHDLIFLRYLLWDTLAKYDCYPVFDAKPAGPNYNGSGLHTNISTIFTMAPGGYQEIQRILTKFEAKQKEHLLVYGEGNEARLTGHHETSSMERFTWGVGSRNTSVRIPYETEKNKCGYFEDRRPAANADPYSVCLRIWKTISES